MHTTLHTAAHLNFTITVTVTVTGHHHHHHSNENQRDERIFEIPLSLCMSHNIGVSPHPALVAMLCYAKLS